MNKVFALFLVVVCISSVLAQDVSFKQYTLGSGDTVRISVYGQDDLSLETRLTDIGVINYPYLGEIKVVGMTVSGLESFIYEGYSKII